MRPGPETISVRWLEEFGTRFENKPHFVNEEQPTALLNNASKAHQLFGFSNSISSTNNRYD